MRTLFVARYYAYTLPASAVLLATFIFCVKQVRQRMMLVLLTALILAYTAFPGALSVDWRDTTEVLRQQSYAPDTPIFVKSGFIEARNPKWLNDEVRLGFLLAPIRMYPIPGTIVALPHEPGPSSDGYMANEVRGLSSREEFFLVDRDKDPWPQWFRFRFGQTFTDEEVPIPSGRGALVIRFRHRVRN